MYPHLKEAGDHEVAGNNRPDIAPTRLVQSP